MPTLTEITQETVRTRAGILANAVFESNALLRRLEDADFGYRKPSAWQAFKYRVMSRLKAAVRWCTRWAWEGYCDCDCY